MVMLVGRQAPDFCVAAVLADGSIVSEFRLHEAIKGKYGIVFFYPLDFTFVCPSELIALDNRIEEFKISSRLSMKPTIVNKHKNVKSQTIH